MEYGYRQAYQKVSDVNIGEISGQTHQNIAGWFSNITKSLRERKPLNGGKLNTGKARNGQSYSDIKGEQ
jgi:argininosuccinate lyase